MSAAELLDRAARQGVTISVRDGDLELAGPALSVHDMSPAIREAKAELLALLRQADSPAPTTITQVEDNRRTCTECAELHRGRCRAAARGELPHAARVYEPRMDLLHRCIAYRPGPEDTDRRTGRERYPGMARKAERNAPQRTEAA